VLLVGVGALLAMRLPRRFPSSIARHLGEAPRWQPVAALLLGVCAVGQWHRPASFDVQTVRAVIFAVGCWALAGLYLPSARWRRALPLALAAAALLPLGDHIDAFVG